MITRIREVEGGYQVVNVEEAGEGLNRFTPDLAEAFDWQTNGFPVETPVDPEIPSEPKDEAQ